MALVFNVDMVDNSVINNIIFNNSSGNNEIRGCSSVLSIHISRSSSLSIEDYHMRIQRDSNNMNQDDPVATSDSVQLKYTTLQKQVPSISKIADISLHTSVVVTTYHNDK